MMAEIKAKAKKANFKNKPSFEVLDVTDAEREKGKKVDAYQAKKAEEKKQYEEIKQGSAPRVEVDYIESLRSEETVK